MSKDTKKKPGVYDESSITTLEFPENVRHRPTMYLPELCHFHMLREILDNALDEHVAGYGKTVTIAVDEDNQTMVVDEGRGIPPGSLKKVLCTLHAGGKFDNDSYATSAGLNGVGASVTNALSRYMSAFTTRDGKTHRLKTERGLVTEKLTEIEDPKAVAGKTGTKIVFLADSEVRGLEETYLPDFPRIEAYAHAMCYLNPGLVIRLKLGKAKEYTKISHPGGLGEYARDLAGKAQVIGKPFSAEESNEKNKTRVQVELLWTNADKGSVTAYANGVHTVDEGEHVTGLRMAWAAALGERIKALGLLKGKDAALKVEPEDMMAGLVAVLSFRLPDPQYAGQGKSKLTNSSARRAVREAVYQPVKDFLDAHPDQAKALAQRAVAEAKGRAAGKAARSRELSAGKGESAWSFLAAVSKLSDCRERRPELREIFLVEGDSAASSAVAGRNPENQAVFALRGKPLNTFSKEVKRISENKELSDLIKVLGTSAGPAFDLSGLKYGKVIIMADADQDGGHIQVLLLGLFWRHMRPLVEGGHVYIARSPLYRIGDKVENYEYFRDEEAYVSYIAGVVARSYEFAPSGKGDPEPMGKKEVRQLVRKVRGDQRGRDEQLRAAGIPAGLAEELNTPKKIRQLREGDPAPLVKAGLEPVGDKGWHEGVAHGALCRLKAGPALAAVVEEAAGGLPQKLRWRKAGGEWEEGLAREVVARALRACEPKHRQRVKGLGESKPLELRKTTMNPATRSLSRVLPAEAESAEQMMDRLLGEDADARKQFLAEVEGDLLTLDC